MRDIRDKLHARVAFVVILLCALLLFLRYPARFEGYHLAPPLDFAVYLKAAERMNAGISPYVVSDGSPYKYAPGVLGLIRLLPGSAQEAWFLFSTLCILGLFLSLLIGARYNSWKSVWLLIIGLCLAWKGILETLDYGQLELIILAIAVGAGALRIRQPVIAGLLAGTLPWLKLPWILLILPLILTPVTSLQAPGRKPRRVRLLISGYLFSWFIWGAAIPSLLFGHEKAMALTRDWMAVLKAQPEGLYLSDINQSFWISALRLFQGNEGLAFALVAILGGYILGCLTSRSLKVIPNREVFGWLSPWLLLTQLLNPLSWRWGSVFVVGAPFAIAGMSAAVGKSATRALLIAAVFGLWALQLNPVTQALGFGHWSAIHGYGVVTAYWLALLLLCLQPGEKFELQKLALEDYA